MTIHPFFPVILQISLALLICLTILLGNRLLGQRAKKSSPIKNYPYECGLIPIGSPHPKFSVKFYITAMLFILFDIEIVFLVPWSLVFRNLLALNVPIITPILAFLALLTVGLLYEFKSNALDWDN